MKKADKKSKNHNHIRGRKEKEEGKRTFNGIGAAAKDRWRQWRLTRMGWDEGIRKKLSYSVSMGSGFAAGEGERENWCSQKSGTTGKAGGNGRSCRRIWQQLFGTGRNTLAKCHEDILDMGCFLPGSLSRQKCFKETKENSLGHTQRYGQRQAGGKQLLC